MARRHAFALSAVLSALAGAQSWGQGAAWLGHGGDPQHTAVSSVPSQSLDGIRWSTSVDDTLPSEPILIHYGSPMITAQNTVIVPVRATSTSFRLEARDGISGSLLWSQPTDFLTAPSSGNWIPSFSPTLTPSGALYYQGAGGSVYRVSDPNSPSSSRTQIALFADYATNQVAYDSNVFISTPLTSDAAGNVYFGYETKSGAPGGIASGIARITPSGVVTTTTANAATGISGATGYRVGTNSAPALSLDGTKLYVGLNGTGTDYLAAIDTSNFAPLAHIALTGNILDQGTSSPTVAPNGDIFFGTMFGYNFRGTLLHFSGDLQNTYTPGSFGWDETVSIVDARLVPTYTGTSSYLVFSKYNNYLQAGGDGVNKLAILDPTDTQIDPVTGLPVMKEILTIAGVTPDPTLPLVKEWCINTAVVDPFTHSILANSEDGTLYRWDLWTNTLTQAVELQANGAAEAYTPTAIGPDGTVYAINHSVLFAVGVPEPGVAALLGCAGLLLTGRRNRKR